MRLLLALFFGVVSSAWGAPTLTGNVNYAFTTSAASLAISRTSQATTNPCMCAFIWQEASTNSAITGVTFNGTSFTRVTAVTSVADGANTKYGEAIYCMTGYSSGVLGNVTITVSPNDAMSAFVQEFNGVHQATIGGTKGSLALSNAASPNAITITTTGTDSLVISLLGSGYIAQIPSITPPGGYTLVYQNSDDAARNNMAAYYIAAPFPGAVGATWTYSGNKYTTQLLFELLAPVTATGVQERNMWLKDRLRRSLKGPLSLLNLLVSPLNAQPMNGQAFGKWSRFEDQQSRINKYTRTPTAVPTPPPPKVTGTVTRTTTVTPTPTPTPDK